MMKHKIQTILSTALLSIAPLALAQDFPTTPKQETLQQAIEYQRHKDAADAAQARKEAGETAKTSQTSKTSKTTTSKTAKAKTARKTGQADSSQAPAK